MNSESSSVNEGTVYYDVRFTAIAPGSDEPITLIINLEIQKVYSIWICPSTPECRKNGTFRYHTIEEPVIGNA